MMKNSIKAYFLKYKILISSFFKNPNAMGKQFEKYCKQHECIQLKKYKDIHAGESCFIIGTGPSLEKSDVEMLEGYHTIGVNTLYKLYTQTDWRSDYYCIIDPKTYGNVKEDLKINNVNKIFIAQNRIREILDESYIPFNLECSSFYKIMNPECFGKINFSEDAEKVVYDGASVVYAAIQIAVYMGFKKIYLLGVDCNYDTSILHNESLSYSKDYKYDWTKQTGLTMIEGFKSAKEYADNHGISIYNATRGGMLEVFPRVKLEDVVGNK